MGIRVIVFGDWTFPLGDFVFEGGIEQEEVVFCFEPVFVTFTLFSQGLFLFSHDS